MYNNAQAYIIAEYNSSIEYSIKKNGALIVNKILPKCFCYPANYALIIDKNNRITSQKVFLLSSQKLYPSLIVSIRIIGVVSNDEFGYVFYIALPIAKIDKELEQINDIESVSLINKIVHFIHHTEMKGTGITKYNEKFDILDIESLPEFKFKQEKELEAVVEITKGSNLKAEMNKSGDYLELDRILTTSMVYPFNYGYINGTLGGDGDPIDIFIISENHIVQGTTVEIDIIGGLITEDEKGLDEKIIGKIRDKNNQNDIIQIDEYDKACIENFFKRYKDLEKGKWVNVKSWVNKKEAENIVKNGFLVHKNKPVDISDSNKDTDKNICTIEIAKSSYLKSECDKNGSVHLDRILTTMPYPFNYGYIENTLSGDGDPVDIVILSSVALFPLLRITKFRIIGALITEDESGNDEKIISVIEGDVFYKNVKDIDNLNYAEKEKVEFFFKRYKDLEKGKWVNVKSWANKKEAENIIKIAKERYILSNK